MAVILLKITELCTKPFQFADRQAIIACIQNHDRLVIAEILRSQTPASGGCGGGYPLKTYVHAAGCIILVLLARKYRDAPKTVKI